MSCKNEWPEHVPLSYGGRPAPPIPSSFRFSNLSNRIGLSGHGTSDVIRAVKISNKVWILQKKQQSPFKYMVNRNAIKNNVKTNGNLTWTFVFCKVEFFTLLRRRRRRRHCDKKDSFFLKLSFLANFLHRQFWQKKKKNWVFFEPKKFDNRTVFFFRG